MQHMQHRDQHSAPEFCFNFDLMEAEEFWYIFRVLLLFLCHYYSAIKVKRRWEGERLPKCRKASCPKPLTAGLLLLRQLPDGKHGAERVEDHRQRLGGRCPQGAGVVRQLAPQGVVHGVELLLPLNTAQATGQLDVQGQPVKVVSWLIYPEAPARLRL